MFIRLKGIKGNRLVFNIASIEAIQEITSDSKHSEYLEHGAKSILVIDNKIIPVKDSIIQIENKLKKLGVLGGAS